MNDDGAAGIVIVGGGAAAHACVDAHRSSGGTSPITMLSAEDRLPYFRPYLTKQLLNGDVTESEIGLDDAGWYSDRGVDVRLGCTVSGLDLASNTVSTDQGPVVYGSLVLATGSSAAALPAPGAGDADIISVRSYADAQRLLAASCDGGPIAVIGSGFVGCEVAAGLRARGLDVTMISREAAPQHERLSSVVGELIGGWLRDVGIDVRGGTSIDRIDRTSSGHVVRGADGSAVEAAHVVVATGSSPNLDLAATAGLATAEGIDVDATMATGAFGVYAVGDIAHAMNASAGRRLRVEHWGDAERMGAVAGEILAGRHSVWGEVPGFWSTIAGNEIKYIAWGDGWDEVNTTRSADGLTVWYGKNGLLVGVLTFHNDEDNAVADALIRVGTPFPVR